MVFKSNVVQSIKPKRTTLNDIPNETIFVGTVIGAIGNRYHGTFIKTYNTDIKDHCIAPFVVIGLDTESPHNSGFVCLTSCLVVEDYKVVKSALITIEI